MSKSVFDVLIYYLLETRQPSISLYLKENRTKPFKGLYLFKVA